MVNFPFTIMDVAALLDLHIRRRQPGSVYTDCPFCGDCRGKMHLHTEKNVFRCNYCDESGGMLALYAKAHSISNSDAYHEIIGMLKTGNIPPSFERAIAKTLPAVINTEAADINVIHHTLSSLLNMLTLSAAHRRNLHSRGLTDEQIGSFGYKSSPPYESCQAITERLINLGCTVKGIPGFYLAKDSRWTVKFSSKTAGMLIPIRGVDGLIRGIQIRLDNPIKDSNDKSCKKGTKYLWLSSSNKHMGVTSGSPVHFVGNPLAQTVYVTEGSLKADVAHSLMNRSFAAIAGANNLGQLDMVFSMLAHSGTKLIVEAHDMDKLENENVARGAEKIFLMAQKYKMEARRLTWDPIYKGIDDWQLSLRAEKQPQ